MKSRTEGEIRPLSESIQSALILAESAANLLEKHVVGRDPEPVYTAAAALIEAGLTILWDIDRHQCRRVYLLTEHRHQAIHEALFTAADALKAVVQHDNNPPETQAIATLVRNLLNEREELIDPVTLEASGFAVNLRSWGADDHG